jgi:hypothetical protein
MIMTSSSNNMTSRSTPLYALPDMQSPGTNTPAVTAEVMQDISSQGGPSMPALGIDTRDPAVRTALIATLMYVALNSGIVNTFLQANLPTLVKVGDSDMQTILIKSAVLGGGVYFALKWRG